MSSVHHDYLTLWTILYELYGIIGILFAKLTDNPLSEHTLVRLGQKISLESIKRLFGPLIFCQMIVIHRHYWTVYKICDVFMTL